MSKRPMRVLIYTDDDCWFAQALEHDVSASGADREEALENLKLTIKLENEFEGGVERLPKAPEFYFKEWEEFNNKPRRNFAKENTAFEQVSV